LQKDFVKAIAYTRQSIDLIYRYAGSPGIKQPHVIKTYNNLRICYDSLGLYARKMEAIDSAIAVSMRLQTGYEYSVGLLYPRLMDLFAAGDYYRCLILADFSEKVARAYGYGLEYLLSYRSWKTNSLIFLKRFNEADSIIQASIAACRQAGVTNGIGSLYSQLATIQQQKGDITNALANYKTSLAYDHKSKYLEGCSVTLNNIGYVYLKDLHKYDVALNYFSQSLTNASAAETLNILDNIANTYVEKGKYDSALIYFQRAFDQVKPGLREDHLLQNTQQYVTAGIAEYIIGLIIDKGNAYLKRFKATQAQPDLQEAVRIYKTADRVFANIREAQQEMQSRLFWRSSLRRLYENAIEACYMSGNANDAFYFFERNRAVLLNDQLSEQRWIRETDMLEQAQIKKLILQLERQPQTTELQKELITRKQDLERLRARLKQNPLYYDTSFVTIPLVRKEILKDHSMLLELFTGDSAIYSLLITNDRIDFDKIDKPAYDKAFKAVMASISDPVLQNSQFNVFAQNASQLYKLIFAGRHLPPGRTIISTDGYNFPFEAMVTNNSVTSPVYFITAHPVTYAYSARYLLNSFSTKDGKDFLGIAPVNYAGLPSLPGSDASLQKIQSYFNKADNLISTDAAKDHFLKSFSQYKILQLYTHASGNSGMGEPVIYFADSVLYLSDLISGSQPATALVILSACETGTGKLYQGEGVFSFNRGFAAIGIPSAVANLWPVDNLTTYKLTEIFHKHVANGDALDIALQKAKLELMQSGSRYALPYYWAAATLTGKDEAVIKERSSSIWWIVLLGGVVLSILLLSFKKAKT